MPSDGLRIREVAPEEAPALHGMTWPFYRPILSLDEDGRRAMRAACLAAWDGPIPVGLLTSMHKQDSETAQSLLSLWVAPDRRRRGIGRRLLQRLEHDLSRQGTTTLETQYSDRLPGAAAFGALLPALGWPEPEAILRRICGPVRETFSVFRQRAGILERLSREGFRVRSWGEDSERALAYASAMLDSGIAPPWSTPHNWLSRLHPDASMVLVTPDDQLCGWVICQHQPELSRWYFPIGWVQEPQAGRGWLLGAYAEGARRLALAHGDETRVVVESAKEQPGMWRVLGRHFVPYADWSDHLMWSRRALAPAP